MDLRSARMVLRPWQHYDEIAADAWPPYNDPLEPIWNLSRSSSSWSEGFEFGVSRRTWAVESPEGRLMGRISLREIDSKRGCARLGVTFGAPYVGKGLGTESIAVFLDMFFGELNFELMLLDVAAPNRRAVRCYERLGFHYAGSDWRCSGRAFDRHILDTPNYSHLRQYFRQGPRCFDVQFFEMELPKRDWLRQRTAL